MPVRKIPPKHLGLTGMLKGRNGDHVAFESSLERDFIQLMLFNPDVTSIEEQPVCIPVPNGIGFGKNYVPDFLVHYGKKRPRLVEVKPSEDLSAGRKRFEDRFRAAKDFARSHGWIFEVWTDREIRIPRLAWAQFLLPFREQSADQSMSDRLRSFLSEARQPLSVSCALEPYRENREQYGASLRAVWCLLAAGTLTADFDAPVGLDIEIWVASRAE